MKAFEAQMGEASFWTNRKKAEEVVREFGELKDLLDAFDAIEKGIAALKERFSEELLYATKRKFRDLELRTLFTGKYDAQTVVLSIYPGAGGDDAEDWARMLGEMYQKYAERRGWKTKMIDDSIRSCTFEVQGSYAYGYLKREMGVHRLVRISPFSSKKLRHTSFALVEVLPNLPSLEESNFVIPEKDLRVEFSRSSGPGGQNVNKLETAVRVVHIPTGIAVASQAERSQVQNRERAMSVLKAKLFQLMEREQVKELRDLRVNTKPEWGNQIRSYVLNPYQLVKDHRTEVESTNPEAVLNGDLDTFIEAEVESIRE